MARFFGYALLVAIATISVVVAEPRWAQRLEGKAHADLHSCHAILRASETNLQASQANLQTCQRDLEQHRRGDHEVQAVVTPQSVVLVGQRVHGCPGWSRYTAVNPFSPLGSGALIGFV